MWLINSTSNVLSDIDIRVQTAIEKRKQDEKQRKLARERKVLKNKIAAAFPSNVDPEQLPLGLKSDSEPEDIFTQQEGLEFLSSEIGLTVET